MPIDFHDSANRLTYTTREADPRWRELISKHIPVKGKKVLDLGCGGGIYSQAFMQMGAASVIAMDFSREMLNGAAENCKGYQNIQFIQGSALQTGLANESVDILLERALIHHLNKDDLFECFQESFRVLKPNGFFIVQDRTPEDCLIPGSNSNIRGYFFERYPKLLAKEKERRHPSERVTLNLRRCGFQLLSEQHFWEIRKAFPSSNDLRQDLLDRTGRSILYDLNDLELEDLTSYVIMKLGNIDEVIEEDAWTVWFSQKV